MKIDGTDLIGASGHIFYATENLKEVKKNLDVAMECNEHPFAAQSLRNSKAIIDSLFSELKMASGWINGSFGEQGGLT